MPWVILAVVSLVVVIAAVAGVLRLIHMFGKAEPSQAQAKKLLEEIAPLKEIEGAIPGPEWFERARKAIISATCAPPMSITDTPGKEEFPLYVRALEQVASGQTQNKGDTALPYP